MRLSTKTKPKAIGYARVSTSAQVKHGFAGCDDQAEAIARYARQEGLNLLRVERDEGVSGAEDLGARDGLPTAMGDLMDGDATVLIVTHQDRLARDLLIQETIVIDLEKHGAQVHSIAQGGNITDDDPDSPDPNRVFIRQMIGAIAQLEKATIRARLMRGKRAKRRKNPEAFLGGRAPYGKTTKRGSGNLHDDQKESVFIDEIVLLRKSGLSYRAIGRELIAKNCHPRTGAVWHPVTLKRICERAGIGNGEGTGGADY